MVPPEDAAGAGSGAGAGLGAGVSSIPANIRSISSWDIVPPEDAAGAGSGAGALASCAFAPPGTYGMIASGGRNPSTSPFANAIGITLKNSLSSLSAIFSVNPTTTFGSSSTKYLLINSCSFSTSKEIGVEILTILPRNSDSAVADAPIIWFMTSQTALMLISFSSKSSSGISMPMTISTITLISCLLRSMTFSPSNPAT
jgi:hypothetical protein